MNRLFALLIVVLVVVSCRKPDMHPPEPVISYEGHSAVSHDTLLLYVGFEDGDGDIGFLAADSTRNLELTYIEVRNGVAEEVVLPEPFTYSVPDIQPSGKNKFVKGTMTVIIYPFYYIPGGSFDYIRYKVKLTDKAGHESNEIETDDISVIQ